MCLDCDFGCAARCFACLGLGLLSSAFASGLPVSVVVPRAASGVGLAECGACGWLVGWCVCVTGRRDEAHGRDTSRGRDADETEVAAALGGGI
eukprot:6683214-Prymnesium_polylepis.1